MTTSIDKLGYLSSPQPGPSLPPYPERFTEFLDGCNVATFTESKTKIYKFCALIITGRQSECVLWLLIINSQFSEYVEFEAIC